MEQALLEISDDIAPQVACPASLNWRCFSENSKDIYQSADPWPHLVVDGLFDPELVKQAEAEETSAAHQLPLRHSRRRLKASSSQPAGSAARGILAALISDAMVGFLRQLTEIDTLVADPSFYWAGIHATPPGGYQTLHTDFRRQPVTRLFHRVNILLYLNSDWPESYGGHLELYTRQMHCTKRVLPTAGRAVIFETSSETCHAVAPAIGAPDGKWRLALSSFYYATSHAPDDRRRKIIRKPKRPEDPWHMGFGTPPAAIANLRQLLAGVPNLRLH
jgi:hypothetical protein